MDKDPETLEEALVMMKKWKRLYAETLDKLTAVKVEALREAEIAIDIADKKSTMFAKKLIEDHIHKTREAERKRCEDIVCGLWPDLEAIRTAILKDYIDVDIPGDTFYIDVPDDLSFLKKTDKQEEPQ